MRGQSLLLKGVDMTRSWPRRMWWERCETKLVGGETVVEIDETGMGLPKGLDVIDRSCGIAAMISL